MKSIIFSALLVLSIPLHANVSTYVACTTPDASEKFSSYNMLFKITDNKLESYALNVEEFDADHKLRWTPEFFPEAYQVAEKRIIVQWGSWYDVNHLYSLDLNNDILSNWIIKAWRSGNDAEDMDEFEVDEKIECDVLKSKPTYIYRTKKNIASKLQ